MVQHYDCPACLYVRMCVCLYTVCSLRTNLQRWFKRWPRLQLQARRLKMNSKRCVCSMHHTIPFESFSNSQSWHLIGTLGSRQGLAFQWYLSVLDTFGMGPRILISEASLGHGVLKCMDALLFCSFALNFTQAFLYPLTGWHF